jgi:hypothetical protein
MKIWDNTPGLVILKSSKETVISSVSLLDLQDLDSENPAVNKARKKPWNSGSEKRNTLKS